MNTLYKGLELILHCNLQNLYICQSLNVYSV